MPPEVEDRSGDLSFGADYTVTSTADNGGQGLTGGDVDQRIRRLIIRS